MIPLSTNLFYGTKIQLSKFGERSNYSYDYFFLKWEDSYTK